jgi:hypothetical protein
VFFEFYSSLPPVVFSSCQFSPIGAYDLTLACSVGYLMYLQLIGELFGHPRAGIKAFLAVYRSCLILMTFITRLIAFFHLAMQQTFFSLPSNPCMVFWSFLLSFSSLSHMFALPCLYHVR